MTKAATLTLISDLSFGQTDATHISNIYDDVVTELGQLDVLVRAELIASVIDQATYSLTSTAIKKQAIFFDDEFMDEVSLGTLEAVNIDHRDEKGKPLAVYQEALTEKNFNLYPIPDRESGAVGGGDFGTSFPINAITSIHTNFESDLPVWLELPIAYTVLYREFIRESNHKDAEFAEACGQMATILWSVLGINLVIESATTRRGQGR